MIEIRKIPQTSALALDALNLSDQHLPGSVGHRRTLLGIKLDVVGIELCTPTITMVEVHTEFHIVVLERHERERAAILITAREVQREITPIGDARVSIRPATRLDGEPLGPAIGKELSV
jgi:hypothetical protein